MKSVNAEQVDAIARFESYLQSDPTNTRLWIEVGDLYHQSGQFDRAQACFEKALLLDPEKHVAKGRLAAVFLSQQRFIESERLFDEVLSAEPDNAAIAHNKGLALFYQHQWERAEQCFERADQHELGAPSNLAYWARALHYQEKLDEASVIAQRWLDTAHTPESKGYMALLSMDNGNMEVAEALALETLIEDPSNTDAATVAGNAAVEQQRIEDSIQYFQTVLDADPSQGRAWLGIGLAHMHESRHDVSVDALKRAVILLPGNAGVLVTLGWAYLNAKHMENAEKTFRQAIEVDRNFAESHGGLAVSLMFQQKLDEARSETTLATKLDPKSFGSIYANAILLKLDGRGALAEKLIEKTLNQAPIPGAKPLIEYLRIAAQRKHSQRPPSS